MAESKLDKPTIYRKVRHAVRLAQEEQYEDALLLFEMYLPLLSPDNDEESRLLAMSSSYCGVCLAKVRHRFTEALEYYRVSLRRDIDPDHRANTALVYLERHDRRRAIVHLFSWLRTRPYHPRILAMLQRIGSRRQPVLRFLKRGHPLNIWLGKMRARRGAHRGPARSHPRR